MTFYQIGLVIKHEENMKTAWMVLAFLCLRFFNIDLPQHNYLYWLV